jgi:hypothetical protein
MAYYAIHHCWLPVTYSQSYQLTFIGFYPTHFLSLHATCPVPCILLSSRDCSVCFVITKINGCTTCTFAFNSTVPKRKMMQNFLLTAPPIRTTKFLVSLGLIFWLDGWDPSASSKNNRSPIHTASVTQLCIDNLTGVLFNACTFPFACGPGKADHNIIFQALRHSLDKVQASEDIVWSDHQSCWTSL